ncbi:3'-5' exonuclease [Roseateles sp. LYH14W]|uniref:3'-5' exonuclease n=1 Tax=Pelomonas parva TaxID=3299032 RepID=A0ABW7F8V5_9BURK
MKALTAWWARRAAAAEPATRWIVLDVETSGLDVEHDRLLAIAGIALDLSAGPPVIRLGDSFELLLRQQEAVQTPDEAARANILLHGIGLAAQRGGRPAAEALQAFAAWVGEAPLLAFHAPFDRAMIQRDMQRLLGRRLRNRWADLAPVAAALHPMPGAGSLDDWMARFGIRCAQRHRAAADTLATAELLLRLWPTLNARGETRFADLQAMGRAGRWLGGL